MIWQTWRQHRAEATVGAALLAAAATAMLIVGTVARDRASGLGLPACLRSKGDCGTALDALHGDFHSIPSFVGALIAVPLLAGMFWAAPLVSREYEQGTHRLAWTQSVSPLRWITMKIVLIFGILTAAALALGLLATWALDPLTLAFGGRYNSVWFDTQGLVPVACVLFALAVGVAASALIRRTIPAMATTLVVYAAARIPIHFFRLHFAPSATQTHAVPLTALLDHTDGMVSDFTFGNANLAPADVLQGFTVTDPSGKVVPSNTTTLNLLHTYCHGALQNDPTNAAACQSTVRNLSLRVTTTYQPGSHFWLIQTVESAIFLAAAAAIAAAAILAVTRRRLT